MQIKQSILPADELPQYTYRDYQRWEGQWELIAGVPFAMSPLPTLRHQAINGRIVQQLSELLDQSDDCGNCRAMMPIDWKINEDTIVQPDASIICQSLEGGFITEAPKVIFEILSPSTRSKDLVTKYRLYQRQGVLYYVTVDPDALIAVVHQLVDGKYTQVKETSDELFSFAWEDCSLTFDFSKIWKV
jgi:Uma2 family endonuclease